MDSITAALIILDVKAGCGSSLEQISSASVFKSVLVLKSKCL